MQVVSAALALPLVRDLAAVSLFAAYSDVDGGVQSTCRRRPALCRPGLVVGRAWPVPAALGRFDQRLTTGLESRAYLDDSRWRACPGACRPSGESVVVQPLTLDYAAQSGGRCRPR